MSGSFIAGAFVPPSPVAAPSTGDDDEERDIGSILTCGNIGDDRTRYCHSYNPSITEVFPVVVVAFVDVVVVVLLLLLHIA